MTQQLLQKNVAADRKKLVATITKELVQLKEDTERNYVAMTIRLGKVMEDQLYADAGYESFETWVQGELKWSASKGNQFLRIYRTWILECERKPEEIEKLGWSRVIEVARVVDKESAPKWIEKLKDPEYTVEQIRSDKRKEKARQEGKTEKEVADAEEVFDVKYRLKREELETVQKALNLAGRVAPGKTPSQLLEYICLSWSSTNVQSDLMKNLVPVLQAIERVYGAKVTAYKDGKILYA